MPHQVYLCEKKHGVFEVIVSIRHEVPKSMYCPRCGHKSPWVPSAPNFIGGPTTGAKKE